LSFFDDDGSGEDREPSATATRQRGRPRPRRPQPAGTHHGPDHHTIMVRRRIAAAVGVVLVIVLVLAVSGCLKSQKVRELQEYNHRVNQIARESDQQVSHQLFRALLGASGRSPLDVEVKLDELHGQAQTLSEEAAKLSVPGDMAPAQRNLLLALDLRAEGVHRVAGQVRAALGGHSKQASANIAGAMENFLASDVVYAQRVTPLIQQTLTADGVNGETTATSHFLPNIGWLESETVLSRITGKSGGGSGAGGPVAPGTHGHKLTSVAVGENTLQEAPALNHIAGGANPTFTVGLENSGENVQTNVKVSVSVEGGGKTVSASHTINRTEPHQSLTVDIPVSGVTLATASTITVYIEPVPGETETENNKGTYDAEFQQ